MAQFPDYYQRAYQQALVNRGSYPYLYSDGSPVVQVGSGGGVLIHYVNPNGYIGITSRQDFTNPRDPGFVPMIPAIYAMYFGRFNWAALQTAYQQAVAQQQQQSAAAAAASTGTGADPSSYVPPASTPPATIPPGSTSTTGSTSLTPGAHLAFQNSRGSSNLQPGDNYTITITGAAPNTAVTASATHNGTSMGTTPFGATDGSGNFQLQGQIDAGSAGNWSETWFVGGVSVGSFSFSVGSPASSLPPASTNGTITPSGGVLPSPAPSTGGESSDLIAGISNKTLLIGGGALLLLMTMMGGRR